MTPIFKGIKKNLRSVALVTKKLRAILDFFYTDQTFYRTVSYALKKIQKNTLD